MCVFNRETTAVGKESWASHLPFASSFRLLRFFLCRFRLLFSATFVEGCFATLGLFLFRNLLRDRCPIISPLIFAMHKCLNRMWHVSCIYRIDWHARANGGKSNMKSVSQETRIKNGSKRKKTRVSSLRRIMLVPCVRLTSMCIEFSTFNHKRVYSIRCKWHAFSLLVISWTLFPKTNWEVSKEREKGNKNVNKHTTDGSQEAE